jgi:hypothetical protein
LCGRSIDLRREITLRGICLPACALATDLNHQAHMLLSLVDLGDEDVPARTDLNYHAPMRLSPVRGALGGGTWFRHCKKKPPE